MGIPGLGSLIGGPLKDLISGVGDVVDKFVTTDKEKLEAQRALLEIERGFQTKMAELDGEWAKTQASIINAETNSQSWLARNWRPLLMLVFTYIVAHNFVIAPIFHLSAVPIPPDMWDLLRIGMGGYIVGRSLEKIAPKVTEIVTANKK